MAESDGREVQRCDREEEVWNKGLSVRSADFRMTLIGRHLGLARHVGRSGYAIGAVTVISVFRERRDNCVS